MKDNQGCHGKHAKVPEEISNGVKEFIDSIPKIESHYIRANLRRHYIDGSKSITDLHRDYVQQCKVKNLNFAKFTTCYCLFTNEYNISFFVPKKDLCDVCEAFKNSTDEEKNILKDSQEKHIREKELFRIEKENDKNSPDLVVAVYDLQAVFQCPKGEVSVFYYKSKLNVLNLTIYDIKNNTVESYVWDESSANRGVNEIGTCVYTYMQKLSDQGKEVDVVFYSDNCGGQQKNKFMISMYLFAVNTLPNIRSITHKFLIKVHTQNEGDSAHSQIEKQVKRQLRSGPMYSPDAFITAIKTARISSQAIKVNEMGFEDFTDWKNVCTQMGFVLLKDEHNNPVKLSGIKIIKVHKNDSFIIEFKDSYADEEFKKAVVMKKKKSFDSINTKNAYVAKPGISEKKKADLMDLVNKNLILRYYRPFYEALYVICDK